MFNTLYLLNYNDYYNRIIKKYDTIADYEDYIEVVLPATNFNPADGLTTTHLCNISDSIHPDYAIVTDDLGNIVYRWFVINEYRKRGEQWELQLYRDVVSDHLTDVLKAPCFIEKATLPSDSPLIFNKEDFQVNQIKTSETLLKDKSGCAWLVGYLNPDQSISEITIDSTPDINKENIGKLSAWPFYQYSNLGANNIYINGYSELGFQFTFIHEGGDQYFVRYNWVTEDFNITKTKVTIATAAKIPRAMDADTVIREFISRVKRSLTFNALKGEIFPNYVEDMSKYQNKVIQDSELKTYLCTVKNIPVADAGQLSFISTPVTNNGSIMVLCDNLLAEITGVAQPTFRPYYQVSYKFTRLVLTQQLQYTATFSLPANKNITQDIYRMICIPYPDEGDYFQITGVMNEEEEEIGTIRMTRETALKIATSIIKKGGGIGSGTLVYDFQLLPFCPIQNSVFWNYYDGRNFIALQGDSPKYYTAVGNLGVVFEVKDPMFSFNIYHSIEVRDAKLENQCDMYRLCSPNYASIFEFNAAKNNGVNYFNVDCTYKPYQPYIHINPDFNLLYGEDFNDARGLILAGDFSLGSSSDAFTNYQLTNKNYQVIFDRQIRNLETQQEYQKITNTIGAIAGTISGATSGAYIGAQGGLAGMAGGAAIGGVVSGLAGAADVYYNNKLMSETINYTKDLFGYNLDNIKAQPDTLTKVTALNNNNKIYPVLEYYTCTDVEKEAFRAKLKYNGMSVGIIDKIENYIQSEPSYIKGQIIRLENLNEDFHIANAIAAELNKGIFI